MKRVCYKDHTIHERLQVLYTKEDALEAVREVSDLIHHYKQCITSKPYHLSEKDAVLITYGDQVIHPGEEPLRTLNKFLDEYVNEYINSVHILPFYPYSSDDGFSVIDYKDVSPRMGAWEDIESLSKHYRLMVDGVINHISQYSFWFKSFLANDAKYKDFFTEMDPGTDLSYVVRPRTSPLLHPFKDNNGKIRYIWTTFSKDQVDLNYANYKVLIAVLDALLYYVEKGATLIRLDAIAFVWKELGTKCVHLPQTHELIQLMREVIHQVAPEVIIITETNVPHDENISYFGSGNDEAQMVYNFALPPLIAHSILQEDASKLTKWAQTLTLPSDKVCFFNFTASHDGCGMRPVSDILTKEEIDTLVATVEKRGGYVSYRALEDGTQSPYELNASYIDIVSDPKEEESLRVKKMILSQAISLAMPGVPGIYFHSLAGSQSDTYGVKRTGVLRSINREKLNYDILTEELHEPGNIRMFIYRSYLQLLSIRKNEKAFNPYAKFEFLDLHPALFVIHKHCPKCNDDLLAIHNVSNKAVKCIIPESFSMPAFELIKTKKIDNHKIAIEAYETMWIKFNRSEN